MWKKLHYVRRFWFPLDEVITTVYIAPTNSCLSTTHALLTIHTILGMDRWKLRYLFFLAIETANILCSPLTSIYAFCQFPERVAAIYRSVGISNYCGEWRSSPGFPPVGLARSRGSFRAFGRTFAPTCTGV